MRGSILGAVGFLVFLTGCVGVRPAPQEREGLMDVLSALEASPRNALRRPKDFSSRQWQDLAGSMRDWVWPLESVEITSGFGRRGRRAHEGVDLRASVGTPVYASGPGVVAYAGNGIKGYGNMVVIDHGSRVFSVYAHHSRNKVSVGDRLNRGDLIAFSGATGRVSGPHLHYEIRHGVDALDPEELLRPQQTLARSQ